MLLFLLAFARVGRAEDGVTLGGVFFPYSVPGLVLEEAPEETKSECSCWRAFGAFAGGAAGFFGYIPVALSDSRIGVSDTQRLLEWSAVTVGSSILGYWIGKKVDRRQASRVLPARGCH
jgi:hypothetical protein